jgi:hypothetical protein
MIQKALLGVFAASSFVFAGVGSATIIYDMDFSVAGQGSTHDSSGDAFESSPVAGENWELTFGSLNTDGTTNEFVTVGGLMRVQDWGGSGTVTSDTIAITQTGTVDITGAALTIGGDVFNNVGTEGITWFYTLNGDTTSVFLGETELGGSAVSSGTDVGNIFDDVSVTTGDSLTVGFTVNVDGSGDGVEISSLDVDFIPEPASLALVGLGGLAMLGRNRRK